MNGKVVSVYSKCWLDNFRLFDCNSKNIPKSININLYES
jgi:hypothetical protein